MGRSGAAEVNFGSTAVRISRLCRQQQLQSVFDVRIDRLPIPLPIARSPSTSISIASSFSLQLVI
jgi:hypothetical protein